MKDNNGILSIDDNNYDITGVNRYKIDTFKIQYINNIYRFIPFIYLQFNMIDTTNNIIKNMCRILILEVELYPFIPSKYCK